MTLWTLISRSFRYHLRTHVGTVLGVAVSSAVLVGALVVGDSIRGSLRSMALSRVGKVEYTLASGDRFFREKLASEMAEAFVTPPAPVLQLPGIALNQESSARANKVQIIGVDPRFWNYANSRPGQIEIPADSVVLNKRLAEHLSLKVGDSLLLRMHKPSLLSREMPITPQEDFSVTASVTVHGIVSDDEMGRFSLEANQIPPLNAFVPLALLQQKLGLKDKANLLLCSAPKNATSNPDNILRDYFKLADAELELVETNNLRELRSSRIFMEPSIVRAADAVSTNNTKILTYFVNELRVGDRNTPYSMVTAATAPLVPAGLRDDEILVNQWLAEDLNARAGDSVEVSYFVMGADQRLQERTNHFKIRTTLLLKGPYADRTLMPEFPGIAKAEKTENWDAGFAIDMSKIRPKDEEYWKNHRGTPKAFINLAAGQSMWASRFGEVTSIRWREPIPLQEVQRTFSAELNPTELGFAFQPTREQALAASNPSQDYGQLFLGFSFFLIAAALILVGLLFQLGLERRAVEAGTLLSLGFKPTQVRRVLLFEGGLLATVGTAIGIGGGIYYAKAMLHALTTIWHSAVGTTALKLVVTPLSIAAGVGGSLAVTVGTIWMVTRKQARRPARELLSEGNVEAPIGITRRTWAGTLALITGIGAVAMIAWAASKNDSTASGLFFGAGALLLIGSLSLAAFILRKVANAVPPRISFNNLLMRNAARRRKRSLATIALLACGTFLVVAVGAFRLETQREAMNRNSGTGGFAMIGETALPVTKNLNEPAAREFFALDEKQMADVSFVAFRVRDGDDASCLNLNSAQRPRLLGVQPLELSRRKAFSFAKVQDGLDAKDPWLLLQTPAADAIPAIGDAASIQWALRKKVGDTIDYTDEQGRHFKIRLVAAVANSILQGSLIIDEAEFVRRFPGETGHRMFLIDSPSNKTKEVAQTLSRALRDVGLELTPTTERLAAFNAVQNTYLSTFQVLGGLGLLLGSAGLAVVVLRNVLERRGELALLLALGFRRASLRWLVLGEHAALLVIGLIIGLVCAIAAILPALLSPGAAKPHWSVYVTVVAILLSGVLWTFAASMFALRGKLLNALRSE